MDTDLLPSLHLIYAENPSDSRKDSTLHIVHQRWLDGDEFIISSMKEVASIAEEGQTVILEINNSKLTELMNRNSDLGRSMFGDATLGGLNIEMVEVATKKQQSLQQNLQTGGAIVAFCSDGSSQAKLLEDPCNKAGFLVQSVKIIPSCLTEMLIKVPFQIRI
ncbi:hypothetical protein Pint_33105 [Pistacia integerrima]|uniref:Uncharacterized protein n=1 Tax=Pistacia integerrima TaxID=434235 RepID=A0ACC0X8D3_9ROSI|nr:hypothetical protein Pint_33105 [Pistacia integerrima]